MDGTIDAIASDHAPHEAPSEPGRRRAAGFSGIQSAVSVVLSLPGALDHLPRVVAALTTGPRTVLRRSPSAVPDHGLIEGRPAHLTWLDLNSGWTPNQQSWLSGGSNTPFWRQELPGLVLATFARGRVAYLNRQLAEELELA